jgi:hypothetical protein
LEHHADRVGFSGHDRRHLVDLVDADRRSLHGPFEVVGARVGSDECPRPLFDGSEQPFGLELHPFRVHEQVGVEDRHRPKRPVLGNVMVHPLDVVHDGCLARTRVADQQDVPRHLPGGVLVQRDRHESQSRVLPEDAFSELLENARRSDLLERATSGSRFCIGRRLHFRHQCLLQTRPRPSNGLDY